MVEAISMALPASSQEGVVDFAHKSVSEAAKLWADRAFSDLDTPYFMVDDEVKLQGRQWRSASIESLMSILNEDGLRR
jgi:hypothetical protein